MVVAAARHFWNAVLPLVSQPLERDLLREPIILLLECLSETTDKAQYEKKDNVRMCAWFQF